MTEEQKVNMQLNKVKSKMFTKLMKGTAVNVNINSQANCVIEIQAIRDPKTDWGYTEFKFNVKVVKYIAKVYVRDGNNKLVKDNNGRLIQVDREMKSATRSKVNGYNHSIRRVAERELEKYSPMFSINAWRLKCDRVIWP